MAKYIIDIPDEVPVSDELVPFDMCRPSWYWEAYKKGKADTEDEAWEFAWEVLQLDLPVFREIFGHDTDKMDYRDYKYKYEAWKKQKDEIHVGDEIESEINNKALIVYVDSWNKWHCINEDGVFYIDEDIQKYWHKTGRVFPEVAELLKKMREE